MVLEECALSLQGLVDGLFGVNITLSTVDDGNVAETKGNDATGQNIDDVRASIPKKTRARDIDPHIRKFVARMHAVQPHKKQEQ
jgi:hypothetical protein